MSGRIPLPHIIPRGVYSAPYSCTHVTLCSTVVHKVRISSRWACPFHMSPLKQGASSGLSQRRKSDIQHTFAGLKMERATWEGIQVASRNRGLTQLTASKEMLSQGTKFCQWQKWVCKQILLQKIQTRSQPDWPLSLAALRENPAPGHQTSDLQNCELNCVFRC